LGAGELWEPVAPTKEEIALAIPFRSKEVREEVRHRCPEIQRFRIQLGKGEAEAAAIAANRDWAFLADDQAAVDLLNCLYPHIPILRTCPLLRHAVEQNYISCEDAAKFFNYLIVDELGFRARRGSGAARERLYLRCDPLECVWEEE